MTNNESKLVRIMVEIADLRKVTAEVKIDEMEKITNELVAAKVDPVKILEEGVVKGLYDLGDKFEKRKAFIPDLVRGEKGARKCIEILTKLLPPSKTNVSKKVVIGTMLSQHNIGKNLVSTFLSINGFDVVDIGEKKEPWDFYEKAEQVNADMIAVSCIFLPSLTKFPELIDILKQMKVREKYKVIVGGTLTSKKWAEENGADGWGFDANEGVQVAKKLSGIA